MKTTLLLICLMICVTVIHCARLRADLERARLYQESTLTEQVMAYRALLLSPETKRKTLRNAHFTATLPRHLADSY